MIAPNDTKKTALRRKATDSNVPVCLGVVDFRADRVLALVAERLHGKLSFLGIGEARVCEARTKQERSCATARALEDAMVEAERKVGQRIEQVILCIGGKHIAGEPLKAELQVGGLGGRCTKLDERTLRALCYATELPESRCVIHYLPGWFELDGVRVAGTAAGRTGKRLAMRGWMLHGDRVHFEWLSERIKARGVVVGDVVFSGLAAAHAITMPVEREAGVLVLNVGFGALDYVLFRFGCVVNAGVVALDSYDASSVLVDWASLWGERLDEIKERLGADWATAPTTAGVVLAGALSDPAFWTNCVKKTWALTVRVGVPQIEAVANIKTSLKDSDYATVVGALDYQVNFLSKL